MNEPSIATDYVEEARKKMAALGTGWPTISREPYISIPFFGEIIKETRNINGEPHDYWNVIRHFGWSVTFGITTGSEEVLTLIQGKPGVNRGSWELPPGGIGKIAEDASLETILQKTKDVYLRETGYGGNSWSYLGHIMIETGKYRGASSDSNGLRAHMWLAENLVNQSTTSHADNELIKVFPLPIRDFRKVLESGLFVEESAVACAYKALLKTGHLAWK